MGGHSAGPSETGRIINGGFEGQRCDRSDTGNSHHPHANFVMSCSALDPPVQFQKVLMQDQTRIQERYQSMGQDIVHLDQRTADTVESVACIGNLAHSTKITDR